jgi:hypothetical protein
LRCFEVKRREEGHFYVLLSEDVVLPELGLEEVEKFKDVEVTFPKI